MSAAVLTKAGASKFVHSAVGERAVATNAPMTDLFDAKSESDAGIAASRATATLIRGGAGDAI